MLAWQDVRNQVKGFVRAGLKSTTIHPETGELKKEGYTFKPSGEFIIYISWHYNKYCYEVHSIAMFDQDSMSSEVLQEFCEFYDESFDPEFPSYIGEEMMETMISLLKRF